MLNLDIYEIIIECYMVINRPNKVKKLLCEIYDRYYYFTESFIDRFLTACRRYHVRLSSFILNMIKHNLTTAYGFNKFIIHCNHTHDVAMLNYIIMIMNRKNITMNIITYTYLILGYDNSDITTMLYRKIIVDGLHPKEITYKYMLKIYIKEK